MIGAAVLRLAGLSPAHNLSFGSAGESLPPARVDRICVFSELPGVAAAQNPKRPRRSTATLTGMSLSVGRDVRWPAPGATASGHPVLNGSPSFSSLPLV